VQVVCRKAELQIIDVELGALSEDDECMQALSFNAPTHMDITQAPLFRVYLGHSTVTETVYMLIQEHHLINDHIGLDIIVTEMAAIMRENIDSLPAPRQYREHIAYIQYLKEHNDTKGYFTQQLIDIEEGTFPFGLMDTQGDGLDVEEYSHNMSLTMSHDIRVLSRKLQVTPATVFHAAWAMVVARCSNKDDVVFGTVLSGRVQGGEDVGYIIGCLINTLPLRVNVREETAEQFVVQVHSKLQDLLEHEYGSLTEAQRYSGVPVGTPLFSALLNYRHAVGQDESDDFDGVEHIESKERTNLPFECAVDDLGVEDVFVLTAQTEGVSAERVVVYLHEATQQLLDAINQSSKVAVSALPVIPDSEYQRLLPVCDSVDYPSDQCIHGLFEAQAGLNPDNTAVICGDEQLNYRELNTKSNQLAHYLIAERGVGPDSLVGICLPRSLEMMVSLLGVLKAGGAYVPLDPDYPQERLDYMQSDAELTTVLTTNEFVEAGVIETKVSLCLDDEGLQSHLSETSTDNPSINVSPSNLAYVIYTSGSTGKPKGVLLEHLAVVNRIDWMHKQYGCSHDDRILQKTPFSFDVSVWELFWPMIAGAGLVFAEPGGHKEPDYLARLIQETGVTKLHFVPSMLSSMLAVEVLGECQGLKQVFCSGEALTAKQVSGFQQQCSHAELHNLYGPTEAAIDVSFWDCSEFKESSRIVPIGEPIQNTQLYVLGEQRTLVPQGVVGELYIGGVCLARGYLNRPELTAERFVANPFYNEATPVSSERLYRTGDLVRWLPDGQLEYIGRNDFQVKVRGFRIELGEIESALLSVTGVGESLVMANGEGDSMALVGYYRAEESVTPEEVKGQLRDRLPDYMVPSFLVRLDSFPLTPNGKIDRKALPEPDGSLLQSEYVAPQTDTEQKLCEIWSNILAVSVELISTSENFFTLGGDSLSAIKMISQVEQQFSIKITVALLFSIEDLADFARHIDILTIKVDVNEEDMEVFEL
jgi:amino acid adenylation domain-containing protein